MAAEDVSATSIHVPVLRLLSDRRKTYGLRHLDYDSYSHHLSGRIAHLRSATQLTQATSKGRKFAAKSITDAHVQRDQRALEVVLWEAERAWARYWSIISSKTTEKGKAKQRSRAISRLKRSVKHAAHYVALVEAACEPITRVQARAYHSFLKGSLAIEQNDAKTASIQLALSRECFETLLGSQASDDARPPDGLQDDHARAMAEEFLEDVEPLQRYATALASRAGSPVQVTDELKETHSPGHAQLLSRCTTQLREQNKAGKSEEAGPASIVWRDDRLPIRDPDLSRALAKALKSNEALTATRAGKISLARFDRALAAWGAAEEFARQLVEDQETALARSSGAMGASARLESTLDSSRKVRDFVVYQVLSIRLERDAQLARTRLAKTSVVSSKSGKRTRKEVMKQLKSLSIIVKLIDAAQQSLTHLSQLALIEEDFALSADAQHAIYFARAEKALFMAKTYAALDRYPESLSLLSRAEIFTRQAKTSSSQEAVHASTGFTTRVLVYNPASFAWIEKEIQEDYRSVTSDFYTATKGGKEPVSNLAGMDDLTIESEQPKGETFLDIVYNYACQPSLTPAAPQDVAMQEVDSASETVTEPVASVTAPVQKQAGGIWGLFGRRT
ncbi:uncharacterized protein L969DRAFT_88801 [Mixia osmundae IAM 14324]|uniref:Signal recognition particle subunit SRP68 n=1 Tax=Mixia osmundae (strain CBS 9802 / IAM 14324 / JCM 22182 / KY 12970) TaxID=764103 RepID=G7E0J1_MIXOS|nr:uncharacterized protein L969DRAFT_88801 [Mixia osmundae IAM 14324]KEI38362.1 hypothetical protein L969DRAFT_88801 [Mixia osmundae IAM 14324]GAA96351.1 hypothetical protein E5Q_03017 [Mixia osmundae IAM 14324]